MKPYEVIAATRGSDLSPTQRHLLTHIALRAGDGGSCFAAIATLCDDTGLSERTVQGTLRSLVACGVLHAEEKRGRSTSYTVNPAAIPRQSSTPAAVAPPQQLHPRNSRTPAAVAPAPAAAAPAPAEFAGAPAIAAPDQIHKQIHKQILQREEQGALPPTPPVLVSREQEKQEEPSKAKASAARRADFAEAIRVWNSEIVPVARKAGATVGEHPRLDPAKAIGRALRQRLDQDGLEAVLLVFRWYAGGAGRAQWLRENGHELSTLTRASKFEEYLGFARAEQAQTPAKVGKAAHDPPPIAQPEISDEERERIREARRLVEERMERERIEREAKEQRLAKRLGVSR